MLVPHVLKYAITTPPTNGVFMSAMSGQVPHCRRPPFKPMHNDEHRGKDVRRRRGTLTGVADSRRKRSRVPRHPGLRSAASWYCPRYGTRLHTASLPRCRCLFSPVSVLRSRRSSFSPSCGPLAPLPMLEPSVRLHHLVCLAGPHRYSFLSTSPWPSAPSSSV